MSRRPGIYEALEDRMKARQFESEEEAVRIRGAEHEKRKAIERKNGADDVAPPAQRMLFDETLEDVVV